MTFLVDGIIRIRTPVIDQNKLPPTRARNLVELRGKPFCHAPEFIFLIANRHYDGQVDTSACSDVRNVRNMRGTPCPPVAVPAGYGPHRH